MANRGLFPGKEGAVGTRIRASVHFSEQTHADLKLVADLWNALDKANKTKRQRKWSYQTVIERLIAISLDEFFDQTGGRPTQSGREEFIRKAVDHLRKAMK